MTGPPDPHDPFPMRSDAARRLAESVVAAEEGDPTAASSFSTNLGVGEGRGGLPSWSSMSTTTQQSIPLDDPSAASYGSERAAAPKLVRSNGAAGATSPPSVEIEDNNYYDDDDDEDAFLDRPLWESRRSKASRQVLRFAQRWYERLYGNQLPPHEMLRTLALASTLFFMIGGYWLFRSLKDPVLTALCGVSVIPKAKMLSVLVVLVVVSIYNHFLESDNIQKHQLFYLFGTFYSILFTIIALLLMHPTIGLPNQQPNPYRILGWISYCSIESFGSVMVSLFWSFANSNISLETAKASYGVMVATAQLGSILGPTLVQRYAQSWGPARLYLVGSLAILSLQATMRLYVRIYGVVLVQPTTSNDTTQKTAASNAPPSQPPKKKKKKLGMMEGIVEGLVLFYRYNYVKGIFAISCLFMVAVTIVDFTLKVLARDHFANEYPCQPGNSCWDTTGHKEARGMSEEATAAFTSFMGLFGQATNTLSFFLSLLGTSAVIRNLGLRLTLLLFPSLVFTVIAIVRIQPTLPVVFAAMMTLKANSYALNNPTKEILYQPTAPSVKYKAKSWIDAFGARGSKALGSVVTNALSDSTDLLISRGTLVGMAVALFLVWNAHFVGNKFDAYTRDGHIVGGENDEGDDADAPGERDNVKRASRQNRSDDTSCAIPDDDDEEEDGEGDGDDADDKLGPQEEGQDASELSTEGAAAPTSPQVTMV